MVYVYVLWSSKLKKRYIGSCHDLEKRMKEHNRGKQKFTKSGTPWKLVYSEEFDNYSEARKREMFLKTGAGRKYLDNLTLERWPSMV
ncbi:MAG: GIY-YIG nuclease family protein [Candidatus Stahlbacteria bacterium]|nr:GIY-YIG nuclease family protein [Candidatus Stahlbacteria bacterium]